MDDQDLKFTTNHIAALRNLLWPVKDQYQNIYLALGFNPDDLMAPEKQVGGLYATMITTVVNKGTTKQQLVTALKSGPVGHGELAEKLKADTSIENGMLKDVAQIANFLLPAKDKCFELVKQLNVGPHKFKTISVEDSLTDMIERLVNDKGVTRNMLVKALCNPMVECKVVADRLLQFDFACNDGVVPQVDTFSTATPAEGADHNATGSTPTSDQDTLCPDPAPSNVNAVIEQLDKQYIEIQKLVFEAIKRQKVQLKDMLNWIRFPPIALRAQFADLVETRVKLLAKVASVDELFFILSSYWSSLHPDLLGYLINKLKVIDLKARMDRYMKDLYHFRLQTTLGDLLDKWVGEIPSGYQEFVLELGEEWRKKTVEDFEQFRICLSRLQCFGGGHMSFMKMAKSSSIIIVLSLPSHLFPLNLRQKAIHNFFRDENIVRMMVDGQYVYDSKQLADCERELLKLCADKESNIARIKHLLNQPAVDPNFYDEEGYSLMWWACKSGLTSIVTLLLDSGADVNLQNDNERGEIPLIRASCEGHISVCKVLLERGATVDFQDKQGATALYVGSQFGWKDVVELLLDNGASVDKENMDSGCTALRIASEKGHTEVAGVLIARGAVVDCQYKRGVTALYMASQNGQKDVVELLLDSGASVDKENMDSGFTALRVASAHGHTEVAGVLIVRGAVVDYQDKYSVTPLMMAGQNGHREVCQLLLQHGADVNHQDTKNGWSALHSASVHGHSSIVELFIKSRSVAQLDAQTKVGRTALAWAAYDGHTQIVHILLNAGASPDIQDQDGLTALMLATQCGHKEVIQSLLEKKANPNITDKTTGRSAIFFAVEKGQLEIAELLVSGGANVDLKDKNDLTALDTAKLSNQKDVYQLLEKHSRSGAGKDITEEQRQRATTFTRRLRNVFDNFEQIFTRERVLKQASREIPSPGIPIVRECKERREL